MSLEQKVEELTQAIKSLPAELAGILNSGEKVISTISANQPKVDQGDKADDKASASKSTGGETKEAANIAGRKTYVWDKQAKQGQVIEKGEVVPTGENLGNVGKTKWDQLCEKYDLDPANGKPNAKEEESEDDDDLGDLDEDLDNAAGTDGDDLDDGLGLDDDEEEETGTVGYDDVKKQMVTVMKKCGREMALKVFKKFGARNLDEVKKEDYQAIFDLAGKQIEKAE